MIPNHPFRTKKESRREAEKRLRRELILGAAERVFGRRPFHEATMQEIAAEAELGMHGIYEHFESKETLYEEVVLSLARRFLSQVEAVVATEDDPLKQIEQVARVRTQAFVERPAFLPVFLSELIRFEFGVQSRTAPRVHKIIRLVRDLLVDVMNEGVAAGYLRRWEPEFLVRLLMNTLSAAFATVGPENGREGIERCVDLAMEAFLRGAAPSD